MRRNPYVFVVGCPRSGTTLLKRMLDHHPQMAVTEDANIIPKGAIDRDAPADAPMTTALLDEVRRHRRFHRLRLDDAAVDRAAAASETYVAFVSRLFDEVARANGKPFAGHKRPDYARHIAVLDALFPWTRFVHLIRDGRDVTLSALDWARGERGPGRFALWQAEPVAASALWWRRIVEKGQRAGKTVSNGRYLDVRYEDMVAQPRETLESILRFLDLPFSEEALEFHRGKTPREEPRESKGEWLPPTPGLRDWRTQMSPRDVELFEAIAGDVLAELGYERAHPSISPSIAALADDCAARWISDRSAARASSR